MAKDPAFLFYSEKFITGVLTMTFEDRGKYITLLALMHQQGRMKEETIRFLVGSISDNLRAKFCIDEHGYWYNQKLEEEAEKRAKFAETRRENGKKGGRKPLAQPNEQPIGLPTDNLPININVNTNIDNTGKGVQGENPLQNSNLFRKPKVPSYEDVCRVFMQHGGTTEQAEAFYNKHTGTGWFLNGSPIVNYASLVPSFITNWKNNRQNGITKSNGKSTGAAKLAADLAADLQQRNAGRTQGAGSEV